MKIRLQKILAQAGVASRRTAEEMIRQGRVCVNGRAVTELGSRADPTGDRIMVDGVELTDAENKVYIMLHKPPGYITTLQDPEGRPTVAQLMKDIPERVVPVGRLDYDTEGLLVLTNDGRLHQLLQHPRYAIPRTYIVKVQAVPQPRDLGVLQSGVVLEGNLTAPCRISVIKKTVKNAWCSVVLHEGRHRQIKLMFEHIGHRVLRIIRTEFGPLTLANLPQGTYRFLKKAEIDAIRDAARPAQERPRRTHVRPPRPGLRPMARPAGPRETRSVDARRLRAADASGTRPVKALAARRPHGQAPKSSVIPERPRSADSRSPRPRSKPASRADSAQGARRAQRYAPGNAGALQRPQTAEARPPRPDSRNPARSGSASPARRQPGRGIRGSAPAVRKAPSKRSR